MKDEVKEYCVQYHELQVIRNPRTKHFKYGNVNVVWSTGVNEELTETVEFKLRHFRAYVLPLLETPVPFVFVQLKKRIYVYQFGELDNPELLLEAGKSGKEISEIHFISDTMNIKKCQEVLNQFPNLNYVYFDILGFADDALDVTSEAAYTKVRNLVIKAHKPLYSELDEDKMEAFQLNCAGFLNKFETMFPNLKKIEMELPLENEVHMGILSLIRSNKIFKRSSWVGGFKDDKLLCHAPVTPEERRRLSPGIAALLCIEEIPTRKPKPRQAVAKTQSDRGQLEKPRNGCGSSTGGPSTASNATSVQKLEPEVIDDLEDKDYVELLAGLKRMFERFKPSSSHPDHAESKAKES